jgi:hypothetical protein
VNGNILPVSGELYARIWQPLALAAPDPESFWVELFDHASQFFSKKIKWSLSQLDEKSDLLDTEFDDNDWLTSRGYVDASNDPFIAETILAEVNPNYFASEANLIEFLESLWSICREIGGDGLATEYNGLFSNLIETFNLKYELRYPLLLFPTIQGIAVGLLNETQSASLLSPNLQKLKLEFDESVRDLRNGTSETRIKNCLNRHYMFVEALADFSWVGPGKKPNTLGQFLNNGDWPHVTLKQAAGNLYGLRSAYPGIGHGTDSEGVFRDIDARDLVGVNLMIAGLVPYITSHLNLGTLAMQNSQMQVHNGAHNPPTIADPVLKAESKLVRIIMFVPRLFKRST